MSTFVILAAGRGSRLGRLGDELPKALLPLDGRAIISHQFALAPADARLVVVTGYRADQVEEYVRLAHPDLDVTFVREVAWGRGPGASLLLARPEVGDDDMIFVACDTLWERDPSLWTDDSESWVAVAPLPAGTPAARWCRIVSVNPTDARMYTSAIDDKTPTVRPDSWCWTALARISAEDLPLFWQALVDADLVAGEVQLSSGLQAIKDRGEPLWMRPINWLDVGDEQAYRAAVASSTGYDPLKPDQVTYVLPDTGRVVKWHVDPRKVAWRAERAKLLGDAVPPVVDPVGTTMFAYEYAVGITGYQAPDMFDELLDWWLTRFWSTRDQVLDRPPGWRELTTRFYRDKTFSRVMALDPALRSVALDAVTRVDWDTLIEGCVAGIFHGDLTFANVLVGDHRHYPPLFYALDWREDFAGETSWGDLRYDVGKLLSGTIFHWENATHGDFRRWPHGPEYRDAIERFVVRRLRLPLDDVRRIAALCLIGSAALHAAPMDEILVARGCRLLEAIL